MIGRPAAHQYLPAFSRDALLPLYDPLVRIAGTPKMHRLLVELAGIGGEARVLDVGTGTGELALRVAASGDAVTVVGMDPDRRALARAGRKAQARSPDVAARVRFVEGYGERMPMPDRCFDHVVSAFAYHHLGAAQKPATLIEVVRVLAPGGALHLVDFGGRVVPADGFVARRLLREPLMRGNLGDAVPERMRQAGLIDVREVAHRVTRRLGRVTLWRGTSPG